MKTVTGTLEYSVIVDCPECGEDIDIEEIEDDENKIGRALFGSPDNPAKWDQIGAVYECPYCLERFVLDEIEY